MLLRHITVTVMTNEQKNRLLAEWAGECVHDWKPEIIDNKLTRFRCVKCPASSRNGPPPTDFCSSLDLIAPLLKKAVSEFGEVKVGRERSREP